MIPQLQVGDLTVFRMGLGTNRITNVPKAHYLLHAARDLGIHFFDTANIYQDGESELSIASALSPYPKDICISTKGGFKKLGPGNFKPEGHPDKLRQNVEDSLVRLKLNQIYLYQLHRVDPEVPLEESLGALKDLQAQGKICHLGLSDVSIAQIEQARAIVPIVSVQNRYNVFERHHEDVLNYCEQHGIIFMPFYPLGSVKQSFPEDLMQTLNAIAEKHQATPHQIALAWLLQRSPVMLPIPGTLSIPHLKGNIAALAIALSADDLKKLS